MHEFVEDRTTKAAIYNEKLAKLPLAIPYQTDTTQSSWHLYIIRLQLDKINKTHQTVFNALRDAGILVNLHYIPVHLQPYYQKSGFKAGDFPIAEEYYKEAISIPLFAQLSDADQHHIIQTLEQLLS